MGTRVLRCAIVRTGAVTAAVLMMGLWCTAAAGQSPPAQPEVPVVGQSCTASCHKEIVNHKVMHGPAINECGACHVQTGEIKDHTFAYIVPKEQLCLRCHALPHENTMHAPVKEAKCLECHDPHGSEYPRALVADPRRDLCIKCHKAELTKGKFVHGPVAVGACIVCHRPHSSSHPKLLMTDPKSLCLTCHAEVQGQGTQGAHMHAALEQGCTKCHDPHASDHKFQLHESAPALCLSCHKDKFDKITADAKVVHGAITAEGGCTTCHEPHSSRLPALQRGTQPATCLACHDKALKTAEGVPLVNMASLLAANPDHHGPIREGDCTACHDPHAGKNFRLLAEDYPPQFYAPFKIDTFKLCFKCHIPDLVLKASGQGLTQFRNGDQNLHWLHVNQQKGRTCRACHEVHASKRPAHIREAVPFGTSGWMLELNFEQSTEGGSCAPGCHTKRSYNRAALAPALMPVLKGASP